MTTRIAFFFLSSLIVLLAAPSFAEGEYDAATVVPLDGASPDLRVR